MGTDAGRQPKWIVRIVRACMPPGPIPAKSAIRIFLEKHGSSAQALLAIPSTIAVPALGRAREAFYWNMAIAQVAILFIPFLDIMSLPLVLNLGLVLTILIIREGYIRKDERPDCEAITAFMTPALIILFNVALGLMSPALMIANPAIMQRAFKLAVPMGLCRYLLARAPDPKHPYKDLLRLGNRAFFLNGVWVAGALVIITTNVQAVPAIWPLQEFVTNFLTAHTFSLSWRFQLNPLEGISRHQRIIVTLNKDPCLDDLRRKRYYLLTGADWFRSFSAQGLLEMMFFALVPLPLMIGLGELYFGHPGAAGINGLQMAANGAAWVGLLVTWIQLKKLNRQIAAVLDEKIQELRRSDAWRNPSASGT